MEGGTQDCRLLRGRRQRADELQLPDAVPLGVVGRADDHFVVEDVSEFLELSACPREIQRRYRKGARTPWPESSGGRAEDGRVLDDHVRLREEDVQAETAELHRAVEPDGSRGTSVIEPLKLAPYREARDDWIERATGAQPHARVT